MLDISRAFAAPDRARSMITDVSGVACRHATARRIMRAPAGSRAPPRGLALA